MTIATSYPSGFGYYGIKSIRQKPLFLEFNLNIPPSLWPVRSIDTPDRTHASKSINPQIAVIANKRNHSLFSSQKSFIIAKFYSNISKSRDISKYFAIFVEIKTENR
jgi:hypothetical protein